LLIHHDFETNQTTHFLYNFEETILSRLQPVFQTLNSHETSAQTVEGQMIFFFFSLFNAIIFLV
jgi:hypothetical protein